jgi:hypothetical protein
MTVRNSVIAGACLSDFNGNEQLFRLRSLLNLSRNAPRHAQSVLTDHLVFRLILAIDLSSLVANLGIMQIFLVCGRLLPRSSSGLVELTS